MNGSVLPISKAERLDRAAWVKANEPRLAKLSDRQASEIRSIANRFGIPDAERRLKRLLHKKAPGPRPMSQRSVNGVVITVYEPWTKEDETKRRVRTTVVSETDSLDRIVDVDEDGSEIRLIDTIGVEDANLGPFLFD